MAKDAHPYLSRQVEAENYTALWSFLSHVLEVIFIFTNTFLDINFTNQILSKIELTKLVNIRSL